MGLKYVSHTEVLPRGTIHYALISFHLSTFTEMVSESHTSKDIVLYFTAQRYARKEE